MDFAVPVDPRVKLMESEKRDKYLDLAREVKNLSTMNVKVILIVIGALVAAPKVGTALLRLARILRRIPETLGNLLSLNLRWKTIS